MMKSPQVWFNTANGLRETNNMMRTLFAMLGLGGGAAAAPTRTPPHATPRPGESPHWRGTERGDGHTLRQRT
jgi:hypothetical protein